MGLKKFLASNYLLLNSLCKFSTAKRGNALESELFSRTRATACNDVVINNDSIFGELTTYKFCFASWITRNPSIQENARFAQDCRSSTDSQNPLILVIEVANDSFHVGTRFEVANTDSTTGQKNAIKIGWVEFAQSRIGLNFKPTEAFDNVGTRNRGNRYLETGAAPQIYRNHEFRFFKTICEQNENLHITSIFNPYYNSFFSFSSRNFLKKIIIKKKILYLRT